MPSYHKPLDAERHEIRLVKIHPGPAGSPIECSIIHASLVNPPDYTALSYRCGDTKDTVEVTIDGVRAPIYATLRVALHRLRELRVELTWADAISINQEDKQEKSHQIRAIRHVYSKATRTYAWLGEDDGDGTVEAMGFLEALLSKAIASCPELRQESDPLLNQSAQHSVSHDNTKQLAHQLPSQLPPSWLDEQSGYPDLTEQFSALSTLLGREYWGRRWIIQEVTVASTLFFVCGSKLLPYEDLQMGIAICQKSGHWSSKHDLDSKMLKEIMQIRRAYRRSIPILLSTLLHRTRYFRSHDARDNLYALIGICNDGAQLVEMPSYFQDPGAVARDLSRALIRTYKCFDIVPWASAWASGPHTLPSWSIDWLESSKLTQAVVDAVQAPKGINPSFELDHLSEDPNILRVRGIRLGAVVQTTSVLDSRQGTNGALRTASYTPSQQVSTSATSIVPRYYKSRSATNSAVITCLLSQEVDWEGSDEWLYGAWTFVKESLQTARTSSTPPVETSEVELHFYGKWMLENEAVMIGDESMIRRLTTRVAYPSYYFEGYMWASMVSVMWLIPSVCLWSFRLFVPGTILFLIMGVLSLALDYFVWSRTNKLRKNLKEELRLRRQKVFLQTPRRMIVSDEGVIAMATVDTQPGDQLCIFAGCRIATVLRVDSTTSAPVQGRGARYRVVGAAVLVLNNIDAAKYTVLTGTRRQRGQPPTPDHVKEYRQAQKLLQKTYGEKIWWQDFALV